MTNRFLGPSSVHRTGSARGLWQEVQGKFNNFISYFRDRLMAVLHTFITVLIFGMGYF